MKKDEGLLVYDEDEAVAFILKSLPKEMRERITENEIDYVMDVIYDFYEEKGFIEEDSTEEASIDEEEMFNYIVKASRKDDIDLTEDEILFILQSEYEYGKSIGIYNDEE